MSTEPKEAQNYFLVFCKRCEKQLVYTKNFPRPGQTLKAREVLGLDLQTIAPGTRMPDCQCGEGAKWRNYANCELVRLGVHAMPEVEDPKDFVPPSSNYFV